MKIIDFSLIVDDIGLEERITNLEKRCEKLDISLQNVFTMTAAAMPYKPFVDVLLSFSDLKIADIENAKRTKQFINKFKFHKKVKNKDNI